MTTEIAQTICQKGASQTSTQKEAAQQKEEDYCLLQMW